MDCRSFAGNLDDYLSGGLDFAGRFGMERHAEQCYVCQRAVVEAERLSRMARALDRVKAPADFEAALFERLHARDVRRSPLGWSRLRGAWQDFFADVSGRSIALAGAAGSAMVVLGFGLALVLRGSGTPSPLLDQGAVSSTAARSGDAASSSEAGRSHSGAARSVNPPPRPAEVRYWSPARPLPESSEPDYVEYAVPGPGGGELLMRLPRTIRMRYEQPSEEYFLRNVSH